MVIFDGGKSLLLGVKTRGFETDFDEAKLILQIRCPPAIKPSKMMESTLLNQNPLAQIPDVHRQH